MKAFVERRGDSLILRIPKSLAKEIGLHVGDEVELRTTRTGLHIAHQYRLEELLARIRPGNLHKEISSQAPKGRELW